MRRSAPVSQKQNKTSVCPIITPSFTLTVLLCFSSFHCSISSVKKNIHFYNHKDFPFSSDEELLTSCLNIYIFLQRHCPQSSTHKTIVEYIINFILFFRTILARVTGLMCYAVLSHSVIKDSMIAWTIAL